MISYQVYEDYLLACLDQNGKCTAFITWGFWDKVSWLDRNSPFNKDGTEMRKYPLPFDDHFGKKPAYYSMLKALNEKAQKQILLQGALFDNKDVFLQNKKKYVYNNECHL